MQGTLQEAAPPAIDEAAPLEVRSARWWTLGVWTVLWSSVAYVFYRPGRDIINWYTTVVWTLPFGIAIIGVYGAIKSRKIIQAHLRREDAVKSNQRVNVVVTTRGDAKIVGALTRVVNSLPSMAAHFTDPQYYIVTDEGCPAMDKITALARSVGANLLVVPSSYVPPNRTRFKGRAQQYFIHCLVDHYGGIDNIPEDEWNFYLDDDTSIAECTSRNYAAFVEANLPDKPNCKHVAQGILTYPLQYARNWLLWLADAIRAFDDIGRFPATTASGTPLAGLHGENAFWRACIDARIGWDFGPKELVEDSHRALVFGRLYPGRSAWVPARVFGAPPVNAWDFSGVQRGRWARGMMRLALLREIPFAQRWLVLHNMIVWATGIFQPVLVVAAVSFLVGNFNVSPVTAWLAPFWVFSVAYTYWAYWEGLRQNALASGRKSAPLWAKLLIVPGIAYFSLLEGWGGTYGAAKHFLGAKVRFELANKPV